MVIQEIYLLTKHGRFSSEYIESIPVWKRRYYLHLLEKEAKETKEIFEKQARKNKTLSVSGIRKR